MFQTYLLLESKPRGQFWFGFHKASDFLSCSLAFYIIWVPFSCLRSPCPDVLQRHGPVQITYSFFLIEINDQIVSGYTMTYQRMKRIQQHITLAQNRNSLYSVLEVSLMNHFRFSDHTIIEIIVQYYMDSAHYLKEIN